MILRVHIAPLEKWCKPILGWSQNQRDAVGKVIVIDTDTMHQPARHTGCDGREWLVVGELEQARNVMGLSTEPFCNYWACEHSLEIGD